MFAPDQSASLPDYEVIALRYATREAMRDNNFVGGDPHDAPMPLDYYVWVVRNADRLLLIDTGFLDDMAIKRHRTLLRTPADGLRMLGIEPEDVREVVITHLHNDHAGTLDHYPNARFHLQETEMAFATGRHMCCETNRRPYEVDHVASLIRLVYRDRVTFHHGDASIAPGISVHRVGGHTDGLQVVRVHTSRGWVVLASDASHFYEHFQTSRCFPLVFHLGDVFLGYERLLTLASSDAHVIPGHDPAVMTRYPPVSPALAGIAVRLDMPPKS
jgi:glyoxylase-like metal-dependent hydrolase (beta-lactamase superfamily II)